MTMRKYGLLLLLLLISTIGTKAQEVTFNLQVPTAVVKGSNFKIAYTLTVKGNAEGNIESEKTPQADDFKDFEYLFGPATSQSSSFHSINGQMSQQQSVSYVYTLNATKEGTFDTPSASIKFGGKTYTASPRKIKVLPPDKNAQQSGHPGQQDVVTSSSTADKIDPTDIFVRAIFSKTKVAEQEAVAVTFRIYTAIPIRQVTGVEFPEFEGFMTDEFDLKNVVNWTVEHYKGRNYEVADIKKTLLFPQRSGKITIPAGKVDFVVVVKSGQKMMTFFGPQDIGAEVAKSIKTNPVTVDVSELPEGKPLNFSGGIGSFTINSSITSQKITANEPVTIKMEVKGTGNLKLVRNPELTLPKEFEVYDPKVINDYKVTEKGQLGTKTIEYMFIPRSAGKFTIPAVEFSYYDLDSKSYKTLSTPEYNIDVAKDPNAGKNTSATSYSTQTEVKVEQDIRYLKTSDFSFKKASDFIVSQATYWLWYIIPFVLFVAYMIINRNRVRANADVTRMRTRKANKVATKRLKLAAKYLKTQNKDGFYEEILRAVWGYLSDKLTIPVADLNRENVETELTKYGADEILIAKFIEVLDTAEFARYSPAESNKAMDNLYDETVEAIGKMENTVKIKL